MSDYKAPLRDIEFAMNEVLDFPAHYESLPNGGEASDDMVTAILSEAARFAEEVVAPLNQSGDRDGCRWQDGSVTTPLNFNRI